MNGRHIGLIDFNRIFDQSWSQDRVRRSINVFKFYPSYLENIGRPELTAVIQTLRSQHVHMALEASMLLPQVWCKGRFPGDGGQATIPILERIKREGGVVDFLAMNEPLLHGFRSRDLLCSDQINDAVQVSDVVAANVAATVATAREIFPNIEIGDIEAIGGDARIKPFLQIFPNWIEQYQTHTGKKLDFFHIDVDWARIPWLEAATGIGKMLHEKRIPYGMIYNGADADTSELAWTADGRSHYEQFEGSGKAPDMAIFQSWVSFPIRFFPVADPASFGGFIGSYLNWRDQHCPNGPGHQD